MRSGGATALFAAGMNQLAIKHFGRWRSDCYEQYARIDNITLKGIATAMASDLKQHPSRQARLRYQGCYSSPHPHGVV
ncbi:hypothetical protein JG688_00015078 [Phytophthora aleatoria]|uniref:Uncharacterized protein n=1 Tax=Phytophthora aleatoria TaxID=2496075 RepID=A0A8J5IEV5_9STRA|nr:hypothetical protein JG688_00015078 [Phytophthora aleatoria]